MVYCGCLENSWVNSPGSSNPPLSVSKEALMPLLLYAGAFHTMWGEGSISNVLRLQTESTVKRA